MLGLLGPKGRGGRDRVRRFDDLGVTSEVDAVGASFDTGVDAMDSVSVTGEVCTGVRTGLTISDTYGGGGEWLSGNVSETIGSVLDAEDVRIAVEAEGGGESDLFCGAELAGSHVS